MAAPAGGGAPKRRADKIVELKIVLVGDIGVGKTSTVARFTRNQFDNNVESTIGASFMSKEVTLEKARVKFSIWDTAGQEQYHSLVPMYFRQAAAVVLVYDITKAESFDGAQRWIDEVHKHAPEGVIVALAGNKSDLENERKVSVVEASRWAGDHDATHHSISAKTAEGIAEMFQNIGDLYFERKPEVLVQSSAPAASAGGPASSGRGGTTNLDRNSTSKPGKKPCCG